MSNHLSMRHDRNKSKKNESMLFARLLDTYFRNYQLAAAMQKKFHEFQISINDNKSRHINSSKK